MNQISFKIWLKENRFFLLSVFLSVCVLEYSYYMITVVEPRVGTDNIINGMLKCMGQSGEGWMGILYPLFAVLPFSMVYVRDYKSGYLGSLLIRQGKRKYYCEKIRKNFLGGGLALALPLLAFAFHLFIVLDVDAPLEDDNGYTPAHFLAGLAYENVYGYVAMMIVVAFFCGAAYAVFALGISFWLKNGILTLFLPFAGTIILAFVMQGIEVLKPFDFLLLYNPSAGTLGNPVHVALIDMVLLVSGAALFLTGVGRCGEN